MNQRLPPGVTQAQITTAGKCPMNCMADPSFKMVQALVHQGVGGVVRSMHSRCGACLAYWETDTSGKITRLTRAVSLEICPDCRRPMDEVFDKALELGKNLCKNPGHVTSSLLKP